MQRSSSPVTAWQELSALYEQADDLDGAALAAWLASPRIAGHAQLAALRRMLAARERLRGSDFLEAPPRLAQDAPAGVETQGLRAGLPIGPYRLLRPLGAGGMAEVWLAERSDGAFQRRVAIKLMFRQIGSAARDSVAQHFERERDILASLDHPNIAALHDAGVTPSGQPWLALEYVEGRPLVDWCDQARLGIAARVRLFRQVLLAVQHAHAKLVMHRDLKPANILVADGGQVHLLDFGIAKLLEPGEGAQADTELTRAAGRLMTPLYASPEQLRGEPLTIACDVYALGVVLYELLSGERPYEVRAESAARLEQAILEAEPRAPSRRALGTLAAEQRGLSVPALRKALAGDLDAIVLQALAKQPARRYASAEAMLADIDRWLDGEPVKAHAPGALYRWGKFVRRNRLGVGLGAGAMLALAGVATVAVLQGREAQRESARAVAARDFMIGMFRRADPEKARGASITAGELLERGREDVERSLGAQPELQAELLHGIASIQADMGEHAKAADTYRAVEALRRRLGSSRELMMAVADRAQAAWSLGDVAASAAFLDEAQRLSAQFRPDSATRYRLAQLGGLLASERSDLAAARRQYTEAVEQATLAYGGAHVRTLDALRSVANIEADAGRPEAAARLHAEIVRRAVDNPDIEPRQRAEFAYEGVRDLYDAGRLRDALAAAEESAARCDAEVGPNALVCRQIHQARAQAALRLGWPDRAVPALASLRALADDALSPARQAVAGAVLVRLLAALGRRDEMEARRTTLRRLAEGGAETRLAARFKVIAAMSLADAALRLGDAREALGLADLALRGQADNTASPREVAWAHVLRGVSQSELGAHAQGLTSLHHAVEVQRAGFGRAHPMTQLFALNEAKALALVGRPHDALRIVNEAAPVLRSAFGDDAPTYLEVLRLQAWIRNQATAADAAQRSGLPLPRAADVDPGVRLFFT